MAAQLSACRAGMAWAFFGDSMINLHLDWCSGFAVQLMARTPAKSPKDPEGQHIVWSVGQNATLSGVTGNLAQDGYLGRTSYYKTENRRTCSTHYYPENNAEVRYNSSRFGAQKGDCRRSVNSATGSCCEGESLAQISRTTRRLSFLSARS